MSEEIRAWLAPIVDLVDVIPVKVRAPAVGGGRVFVTSVELWTNAVRWAITVIPAPVDIMTRVPWAMWDDVGTAYRIFNGCGGGGDQDWTELLGFEPPLTEMAREIRLTAGEFPPGIDVVVRLDRPTDVSRP